MQYREISFSPPDISDLEIKEVVNILRSGWITTGPKVKILERKLASYISTGEADVDMKNCTPDADGRVVCLNSATAAEELNLRIWGIGPGDEVIVPAYTYTATASAVIHCGATVRFVDIQKDGDVAIKTPEMDYDALERMINSKTKAIVAVDLFGIVCDYSRIIDICERKRSLFTPIQSDGTPLKELASRMQRSLGRIAVFSDSSHGLGAQRLINGNMVYSGRIADFTDFSFHAVKNFTTAEGGAATWRTFEGIDNKEIYHMYQLLSLHGQSKDAYSKTNMRSWEYDIVGPWFKYNMPDVLAGIGLGQINRYPKLLGYRKRIVQIYDRAMDRLGIFHVQHETEYSKSSCHLYIVRIPGICETERNEMIDLLAEEGVATNVHYKPLPMMTAYGKDVSAIPNSYDYYKNLITLPLHTKLTEEDAEYVIYVVEKAVGKYMARRMGRSN